MWCIDNVLSAIQNQKTVKSVTIQICIMKAMKVDPSVWQLIKSKTNFSKQSSRWNCLRWNSRKPNWPEMFHQSSNYPNWLKRIHSTLIRGHILHLFQKVFICICHSHHKFISIENITEDSVRNRKYHVIRCIFTNLIGPILIQDGNISRGMVMKMGQSLSAYQVVLLAESAFQNSWLCWNHGGGEHSRTGTIIESSLPFTQREAKWQKLLQILIFGMDINSVKSKSIFC